MSRPKAFTTDQFLRNLTKTVSNLDRRPFPARATYGTVQPYWTSGLPKVIIDGEDFAREPGFAFSTAGGYTPAAGDRVFLIPSIDGYIIGGKVFDTPLAFLKKFPLVLQNSWTNYAINWNGGAFTRTENGIVSLDGLITRTSAPTTGQVITQLPEGFRPEYTLRFAVEQNDTFKMIQIDPAGLVTAGPGWVTGWVSLAGIAFPAAGRADWQIIGEAPGSQFQNNWTAYQPATYGPPRVWMDDYGMIWAGGMMQPGFTGAGQVPMFAMPTGYNAKAINRIPVVSGDGFGQVTTVGLGNTIDRISGSTTTYTSLSGIIFQALDTTIPWINFTLQNGWSATAGFATPSYVKFDNEMVMTQGSITPGTYGSAAAVAMPAGYRFSSDNGNLFNRVAGNARARLDIGAGVIKPTQGAGAMSLDAMAFVPDV